MSTRPTVSEWLKQKNQQKKRDTQEALISWDRCGPHNRPVIRRCWHGFTRSSSVSLWKSDCFWCAVVLWFVVCLTLLASFILPSHLSLTCTIYYCNACCGLCCCAVETLFCVRVSLKYYLYMTSHTHLIGRSKQRRETAILVQQMLTSQRAMKHAAWGASKDISAKIRAMKEEGEHQSGDIYGLGAIVGILLHFPQWWLS